MKVYEAIVKGLEGVGVEAAFGGAGENAAGLMLALKHSKRIRRSSPATSRRPRSWPAATPCTPTSSASASPPPGPGAFNLFSGPRGGDVGLLPGAGDLRLRVAGVARQGIAERDLGREPHARLAGDVRGHHQEARCCSTDIDETCDVLEEAVNLAFEGRPGPVHIHVPENLDPPRRRGPQLPRHRPARRARDARPGARRGGRRGARRGARKGKKVVALVGFGAIRSRRRRRGPAPDRALPDPAAHHARRQGDRLGGPPAVGRRLLRQRPRQRLEGVPARPTWCSCVGNALNQHATFNYHDDLFDGKTLIHVNISETEIDKAYKADYAIVGRRASWRWRRSTTALEPKVGQVPPVDVDGRDWEHRDILSCRDRTGSIPGELAQAIGRHAAAARRSCWPTPARTWPGSATTSSSTDGQHFRKAGEFGPMAGHVNGAIGLKLAHPDRHGRRRLRRRLLQPVRLRADDRGAARPAGHLGDLRRPRVQADQDLPARRPTSRAGWSSSRTRTSRPTPRPAAPTATASRRSTSSRRPSRAALASGRPTVIDAHITRWALPHYSPSPEGVIGGIVETRRDEVDGANERRAEHAAGLDRDLGRRQRRGRARSSSSASPATSWASSSRPPGRRPARTACRTPSTAPSTPRPTLARRRRRAALPRRPAGRPAGRASPSPAPPTAPPCGSPTRRASRRPGHRARTCAASPLRVHVADDEHARPAGHQLSRSRTPATPRQFVALRRRHRRRARVAGCAGCGLAAASSGRSRRSGC